MNKVSGINDIHNVPDILDVNGSRDLSAANNEPDAREFDGADANALEQHQLPTELARLFMQLSPQDIEQFYQSYQRWTLEHQVEMQQSQIAALQQKIAQNAALMEQVRPSAIALSTLAQLQASGVEDIELLDQMLERGEAWLDRTMQQLEYCERLDLIGESYTEWCRHALEGAYDWIESIQVQEVEKTETGTAAEEESGPVEAAEVTEDLLLQKLMSDDDTGKTRLVQPRITAPLPTLDETTLEADDITASIASSPGAETAEPVAEVASAIIETVELTTEITDVIEAIEPTAEIIAAPVEAAASPVENAAETITDIEPVEATTVEHAETSTLETEQESGEPIAHAIPETFEAIEPAISQTAADVEIDEPDQEEQPEAITDLDVPETTEDDAAPTDDAIAVDLALAPEMEEAELVEPAEAEAIPQREEVEAPSVVAIEPSTDVADMVADETFSENASIVTPPEDTAPAINDTEDILTTAEAEEEQETEVPDTPSDIGLVKNESAALSSVAEPPQEESPPPSIEPDTEPGSVEVAASPQEQPPAPSPGGKPGFFKRLLAFLLS